MIEPDTIAHLVEAATRAPSSHNTQPWVFRTGGSEIDLLADRTRALPANDPDDRELTISCGCALMALRIAAARYGLGTDVTLLPDANDPDLLARVALTAAPDQDLAALFPLIAQRQTYRKSFDGRDVPADSLKILLDAAAEGRCLAGSARYGRGAPGCGRTRRRGRCRTVGRSRMAA